MLAKGRHQTATGPRRLHVVVTPRPRQFCLAVDDYRIGPRERNWREIIIPPQVLIF